MSRSEYATLKASYPYYRPRGRYLSEASRLVDELSARHEIRRALELGAHRRPVATGADVMDIVEPKDLVAAGEVFVADATKAWPFADKSYDLFVALQVFEHLGTSQPEVFREVRRVARNAIISAPVDWVMDDPRNCHHGISQAKVLSWFAPVRPSRIIVGNGGSKKRILFVFEDLPAPAAEPGGETREPASPA
jgi:hypothetical protein